MCELFSAAAYPSSLGRGEKRAVIFQRESSELLVHGEVAIIHFKNSISQLKHYLSVMGPGILSIGKLKLSITLIKSTALNTHTHTGTHVSMYTLIQKSSKRFYCVPLTSLF